MNDRLLAVAIIVAGVLICAGLVNHARTGRYQIQATEAPLRVLRVDTSTGDITYISGDEIRKSNR
jgi:hypothetical protein